MPVESIVKSKQYLSTATGKASKVSFSILLYKERVCLLANVFALHIRFFFNQADLLLIQQENTLWPLDGTVSCSCIRCVS